MARQPFLYIRNCSVVHTLHAEGWFRSDAHHLPLPWPDNSAVDREGRFSSTNDEAAEVAKQGDIQRALYDDELEHLRSELEK